MVSSTNIVVSALAATALIYFTCIHSNVDTELLFNPSGASHVKVRASAATERPFLTEFISRSLLFTSKKVKKLFNSDDKHYCINGTDPSKLSVRDQLLLFLQGPCSPTIVVPGHQGTVLRATINCEVLQLSNPQVFAECGWSTCGSFFGSRPATEYTLWISSLYSPMSTFSFTEKSSRCLGGLAAIRYTGDDNPDKRYADQDGVNITWYGDTEGSAKDSLCGFRSISDIFPIPFDVYQPGPCAEFKMIKDYYVNLGYQVGLTLQAVPYDFRKSLETNQASYTLERAIRYMYELTGKKVIVAGHSLGGLVGLRTLNRMKLEDKDVMIRQFVSMASPFGGSSKALEAVVGGSDDMILLNTTFFDIKFGMLFEAQKSFINAPSTIELMPKDYFSRFRDEPWMKAILERDRLERQYDINTDEGRTFWEKFNATGQAQNWAFPYLPTPLSQCSVGMVDRPDACYLSIVDESARPILKIGNETEIFPQGEDLIDALELISVPKGDVMNYYKDSLRAGIQELKNPEVPTSILFYSHLQTSKNIFYTNDPTTVTNNDKFYFPDFRENSPGDMKVSKNSPFLTGIKWAYEYDHRGSSTGPKPVKLVDVCSIYNQVGDNPYDTEDFKFTKNDYQGIPCDCMTGSDKSRVAGIECDHARILTDTQAVRYLGKISKGGEPVEDVTQTVAANLTEEELKTLVDECLVLRLPRGDSVFDELRQRAHAAERLLFY